MRALSIRQPHAEAILRGVKRIEYRNRRTHIRGRILIYASLGRDPAEEEAAVMAEYGISECRCDELSRGVLVGSVELYDCTGQDRDFHWHVRNPEQAEEPIKPTNHPQPSWFFPFAREKIM
ncbi:MAG: ASCH domain-containing protein [Isosphaerales bacterium]